MSTHEVNQKTRPLKKECFRIRRMRDNSEAHLRKARQLVTIAQQIGTLDRDLYCAFAPGATVLKIGSIQHEALCELPNSAGTQSFGGDTIYREPNGSVATMLGLGTERRRKRHD